MNDTLAKVMEENLEQVWGERNAAHRIKAIAKIYVKNSALYHLNHKTKGNDAINVSVSNTLSRMPEDFIFSKLRPVAVINNIGRLFWGVGPKDKPPIVTGMDLAVFKNGKIKSLYVFLDGEEEHVEKEERAPVN
jgi:hypothetical protein